MICQETFGFKENVKDNFVCGVCSTTVSLGEKVSPVATVGFVHCNCQEQSGLSLSLCGYYSRFGKCVHEECCAFKHEFNSEAEFKRKRKKKRLKTWNKEKASILRIFLLKTFGEKFLKQGSGVLDVAGGNGILSFELYNLNHISSTVLDPRPLDCKKALNRWNHGIYESYHLSSFNSVKTLDYENTRYPNQIRLLLDNDFIRNLNLYEDGFFQKATEKACTLIWNSGLQKKRKKKNFEIQNQFGTCLANWEEIYESVLNSSLIVGLHPDQAAGSLIDLALLLNKPFVIVPCCVFWKKFPRRKLSDGQQVKTEEQLFIWLMEKDERIQETILEFEGKNKVLFFKPDSN